MPESDPMSPFPRDVTKSLQRLKPVAPRLISRDVWYEAGLQAGRRPMIAWRAFAALSMVAALALATAYLRQPAAIERIVYIRQEATSALAVAPQNQIQSEPSAAIAYGRLVDRLVQHGLNGLPPVSAGAGEGLPERFHEAPARETGNDLSPGGWYPMNERG